MKINVAKFGGFCFGVKRAIDIAQKTVVPDSRVSMLGDIVHNEDVINDIARSGIKRIKRIGRGAGKTLILSAHGTGKAKLRPHSAAGIRSLMPPALWSKASIKSRSGWNRKAIP